MDRGAWQATVHGWGGKRAGHNMPTEQQQMFTSLENIDQLF